MKLKYNLTILKRFGLVAGFFIALIFIGTLTAQPVSAQGPFMRNLYLGFRGEDVKELQQFLNSHNFTVASTGPGSIGNETTYFGQITKQALIKFQEFYAAEILTPLGLVHGTGRFSNVTRDFVNSMLIPTPVTTPTPASSPVFAPAASPTATPTPQASPVVPQPTPTPKPTIPYAAGGGNGQYLVPTPTPIVPVITFNSITKNFGDPSFSLSASSTSPGAFSYVCSDPSVATVSGSTLTITGAGSATLTANQAASGNYTTASTTASLVVNRISPNIIFNDITLTYNFLPQTQFNLSPTSTSSGTFSFSSSNNSIATVSGNVVTAVGIGSVTITATQAASGNYTSGTATSHLVVNDGDYCGTHSNPCVNGGSCHDQALDSYSCTCIPPYYGQNCQFFDLFDAYNNSSQYLCMSPTNNSRF